MKDILFPEQKDYLESFIQEKDSLILEMETFAKKNNVPILSRDSAILIELLIRIHKPVRVLEIGTAIAYTAIRIAKCAGRKCSVYTIEFSKDNAKLAKQNIKKAKLSKKIKLLFGDALEIMPKLDKKYDFIFLDADKEDYLELFQHSLKLLKKGGVIFVDNLLWHGYAAASEVPEKYTASTNYIRDFNKLFTNNKKLQTTILPVGDGIGLGIKIK